MFGQFAATTQFFLYGKKHFTRTGWEAARALYPQPDALTVLELTGKTYMVTGARFALLPAACCWGLTSDVA